MMLELDLQLFAQEKTEKATPKKRQESRKKGQVAKSNEIPGALILLCSMLAMFLLGGFFKNHIADFFAFTFHEYMLWDVTIDNMVIIFNNMMFEMLLILSPIMLVAVVFGIVGNYIQIGLLFTTEPLKVQFKKINPIEGAKKIFALRALAELVKSLLKLTIIGFIIFYTLWKEKEQIVQLSLLSLTDVLSYIARVTFLLGFQIGLLLIGIAILDYYYQRYEHEKSIRMSKQDIKDEYKKSEGDPLIKSKIKEKQKRMALQRMMQEVPHADVIVTNPTHFAVALKYDNQEMQAPMVIAKGQDYVAQKIKAIAKEHQIVTMENKPLARALFQQVEIGESIPEEMFQAVAEVLAYVYKMKGNDQRK
ncbi:flagellar biosynthesis protein FlhB [Longirhabdus pacifica]|uniref:flagellar biosynthesis protein FlhB n=1 Tax=Longirhabdus pacifica TaxID=2305227 RepID=UPI0035225B31